MSRFSSNRGPAANAGVPEKVISDRVTLERGQSVQYAFVLSIGARININVRSSRVPVSVKLEPGNVPDASASKDGASLLQPVFWQQGAIGIRRAETLPAGKWTLVIEASDGPVGRRHLDTTVRTEVSVP
jgi:hypothetical protein